MDDKAKAAYYREMADVTERHGVAGGAYYYRRRADELDPPKPEYPVGTIAVVTAEPFGSSFYARWDGWGWLSASGTLFGGVSNVDVIPTLPVGHIAVKDVTTHTGWSARHLRSVAQEVKKARWTSAPRILDAYADALEAKDNQ